ncbi:hypothetical protein DEIPH_ctg025orf0139 [Deinococcus phoenicis]|uniref:Uncharacterized protein n=1 Tax=Deinococcus phoenicis TaxID=1476583 RepID=A0A016QR70_9DEIO|nr:hypothetical protein DEIPH_ctg025orf0139 [Deinococcus phoenicis]
MALVLGLSLKGAAFAGGANGPTAWLGNRVDVAQTAFCRVNRCRLESVRQNTEAYEGWHDGTHHIYRLRGGERLEVAVRPGGWISNAFLFFPNPPTLNGRAAITPGGHRLAAEFLSAVTGRWFSAGAVAACDRAGQAALARDPDVYGPPEALSRWTTPAGLPYRARCGVTWQLGVWAGWQQA